MTLWKCIRIWWAVLLLSLIPKKEIQTIIDEVIDDGIVIDGVKYKLILKKEG